MISKVIGRRLAALRDELARPGEEKWTQAMVAAETGLTLNMVGQMERTGGGGIEIFVAYLLFFHRRGYNINWIVLPDNTHTSKKRLEDEIKTVDMRSIADQFQHLKQVFEKELDNSLKSLEG
jgi:hypothetical protein